MEIHIVNKKTYKNEYPEAYHEYIGRPSILGNPFSMKSEQDREQVVEQFRQWLREQWVNEAPVWKRVEELAEINLTQDLVLVCWCAPLACHGEIIKNCINWINMSLWRGQDGKA